MFGSTASTDFDAGGVAVDRRTGRPREVRAAGERRAVTDLESVRNETAAYPFETGPRRVFVVRAQERRYRLVHLVDEERWTVEELPVRAVGSMRAA